ncbi:MAG TPA: response regulator [Burkholderiales bacterium]|nr:response regulator [Burkholderiales bacterium]
MSEVVPAGRLAPAQAAAFRVLVVDDDPDMAAYLARLLVSEGFTAHTVQSGEAAMGYVRSTPPDLILLDVMMPGSNGFEICERVKADTATALIPIVLVTALEDQPSRVRGIKAGADDFLSKPVHREELVARVTTLRRLHTTRRELESRRLAAEVARKEALRRTFSRYISPRIADRIISDMEDEGTPFQRGAQRVNLVAMFADLRGFTRLTESTRVDEVVGLLNEYFGVITDAAYRHDGTIFSMAGDNLLVGFNVPFPQPDAAARAWRTAHDMLLSFASVHARWIKGGGVATGLGIGIAAGEAILGNVGSPHFMSYTIIGDAVNTASRLVQAAKPGEIVVSGTVYDAIREMIPAGAAKSQGEVALRGKSGATSVWSITV